MKTDIVLLVFFVLLAAVEVIKFAIFRAQVLKMRKATDGMNLPEYEGVHPESMVEQIGFILFGLIFAHAFISVSILDPEAAREFGLKYCAQFACVIGCASAILSMIYNWYLELARPDWYLKYKSAQLSAEYS